MPAAAPESSYQQYIISFHCPDRLGIAAKFSDLLYSSGAYIIETSHYGDPKSQLFFQRCVFDDRVMDISIDEFTAKLEVLADDIEMTYQFRPYKAKPRIMLAVSKFDHCLNALLLKWKAGVLPVDIVSVFSNHEDCRDIVEWCGLPYHYLPITKDTKPQQEQQILDLMKTDNIELLVLARYMQILSDDLCKKLEGRAINIHHSFLPGFKGAKPYHQAYERGVKVIGATAHYVTSDLDEGPIITQEVKPINHELSVEQMVHMGHDIEATALSTAVKLHAEMRVTLNGTRTVIL